MTKCTYVDCQESGTSDQTGRDGSVWARLCEHHECLLETAIKSGHPAKIMSAYIKCQGGAKVAADRAMGKK